MKGDYPQIDKLRAKFDADKPLSLREACWVLWAESCICSAQYLMFAYWVRKNKLNKLSVKWKIWKSLFDGFAANDYPTMRDDFNLASEVHKNELNHLLKIKL
jgi:hypothetical protein